MENISRTVSVCETTNNNEDNDELPSSISADNSPISSENILFPTHTHNIDIGTRNDNGNGAPKISDIIEEAVITDDTTRLKEILKSTPNVSKALNKQRESALILAVKLTKYDIVKVLLESHFCDANKLNVNNFSPLDVALITTFDNRLEPRHSVCWKIVSLLLEHGAKPSSRDAMMYVVRTAFKYIDDQFINQLIEIFLNGTLAPIAHELLLVKLHRSQPIYDGNTDHFLMKISWLALKIIKQTDMASLCDIINSFVYYVDSHWTSRDCQVRTLRNLVLYASATGRSWKKHEILLVNRVSESLANWCQNLQVHVPSLQHLCRVTIRQSAKRSVNDLTENLSLPNSLKQYLLLCDVDKIIELNNSLNNINF
ncbi:hypothetical protein LOTGIDRAFT_165808 [Lottia gigantea]|uniref:SOCS box domain-containing protein n=1 Tax=Lottia gigantea TaxID=225164 RepID=V3ZVK3_LOTGI|nr:hypothetical protein LOTGIDRAFT_165808 [Lottia gigantea]ESO88367.1 hypothetical protein LOTGIDRAFT_165808 [Lottia gigantea]